MGSNQENSLIQKKYIMEDYILNQTDKTISKKLKAKLYRDMKNRPFQQVICSVVNQKYQQYVAISNQTQQRSDQYQYLSSHQNQIVDEIIKEQNIDLKYFSNENKQKDLFQQDNLNLQQEKINYKNNPSQQNVIFNQQTSNQKQISLQQEDIKNNQNILKQIIQIQNISQYDLLKKQDSEQAQKDSDASNQLKDYLNMVVEQDDSRQSELQKLFSQIQQYSYEEYKQCQKWEQIGLGLTAQNCRSTKNQKQIMNQLTLCFNSRILEERFQKEITFTNQLLLRKVFVVHLILVITPSLIISTLQWEKAGMMLFTASMIGSLSQVLLYKMMQKCFNLVINSMILMSSIFVCILIYAFGTDLQINDPNMLFYLGSCIYTIQIGMSLFSSNFIMTSIAKNRRELFLSKENQKQWSEIVKKVIPSSIITVKYDQKNNQLFLDSINDEAKKLLQIFDQDQFKIFSRKTVVFDKFQEIDENEGNNNLEKKQIKQGQTVLNSLENRIISILKQKIQTFERQKSIQISKFKMGKSQDQENKTKPKNNKSQIQEIFYGCFKLEEIQIDKIISIKASPYQKQTDFLCCLVIEEQTNNQKIKALEIINKTFEVNFMQFCLYLENSIKFQRNEQLTTQYDQSVNASNRSRCQSSQYNIQTKRIEQESNYKDSVLSNFLIDFNDQAANKSVFKNDQSANKFEILNSTRNEGNISAFEVLQVQEMSLNKIDVNINIELIKGENQQSNIFKISVQDKGSGMRSSNLIQILEIIANKNTVFNSDYQNYNFIGWKDIDILNQTQINSKIKLFQNSQFQEYLQESNQNYYHVNNIEFLKENIKQNKKNSKIRMKNNSTLSNQLMFQQSNVLTSQFTRQQRTSSINRQIEFHKFNQSTSNYIEESECSLSQKNIKKYTSNQILTVQSALKINQEKFQGFQKYFQEENYEI
ncbi:hypothetical protein ABPG74_007576 [Tetrahymena malaccensis]